MKKYKEKKISKNLCDSCTNKKVCWKPFKYGTVESIEHCNSYLESEDNMTNERVCDKQLRT